MSRMSILVFALLLGAGGGATAHAQAAPVPASSVPITDFTAVAVSGLQPGPGLWKVSRGDHVLWVLGVMPAMPENVQWSSQEVADAIAASQEIIEPPRVKLTVDTGFFGKLLLLPSAYGARKNEDGRTLQQVLPPSLYARWQTLKATYIGNDRGIERWRPFFAAMELRKRALKHQGLRNSSAIQHAVDALAAQHGVKQTHTDYSLKIEHPRDAIKAFRQGAPGDITCFARTLDSVEHELPAMAVRANAWAVGDIATLRAMPDSDYRDACVAALSNADFARQLGISDVPARIEAGWLAAARHALAVDQQSFALLPMPELLASDGLLAKLRGEGYRVIGPDDDEAPAAAGSSASP
jgi:hypothetical protein